MILIKFEICKRSYMFTNLLLDLLQLFLSQGQSILHLLNDLLLQIGIVILSGLSHLLDMLFLNKKNNPYYFLGSAIDAAMVKPGLRVSLHAP